VREQQDVAQHGERTDKYRIPTTRLVFEQARVFSPVVTDFHTAPVTSNQIQPLFGGALVEGFGGEIVANLFFIRLVGGRFSPDFDDGLDVRELDLRGRDALDGDFALVDSPVRFFYLGKKGESFFTLNSASSRMVF
jgi:hypothetical protein